MRSLDEKTLTKTLEFIKNYQISNGRSPSYRTIMKEMKFNSLAFVFRYVNRLHADGRLEKDDLGGISIPNNLCASETILAPVVGTVACGTPIYAEQNIEENIPLPVAIFGSEKPLILHAKGNSMTGIGIYDGDLVFAKPCSSADEGQVVVALVGDSATIKKYYRRNGKVVLHPENPRYKDIIVDDCIIQGIVKTVVHKI